MRQSYFLSILTTFLLLCTTSLAWPWPPNFGELIRRQDNGEGDRPAASRTRASASESGTITAKPDASASETGDSRASDTAEGTGEATATATGTGKNDDEDSKATGTEDASASESAAMTTFDERLPAGGIQLITPAPISGSQYYKIGDDITFKWNYTSVSKTPSKIDVLVSCSKNQATYTIAANQSVEETGSVLFDSKKFATGTAPLFEATYTLIVHDSDEDVSATPRSGYLGVSNQFTFGMYVPDPYVKWKDWTCSSCLTSAGVSRMEVQTAGFMLAMSMVTVLSFSWFVMGAGVV